jgi:hypothetical protein
VKQDFRAYATEGEIREAPWSEEDEVANEEHNQITAQWNGLCMTRASNVYCRLRERMECGTGAGIMTIQMHDGCSRTKPVYWLLGWVQSRVVIEGGLKQNGSQVQQRSLS